MGDPESVARAICLRLLDQRARTRQELAGKLRAKGVPDDAAAAVLDRLTEVGLIDDQALAAGYAESQHRERGLAASAVALKLRRRGVADEDVAAAVAGISRDSEAAAARRLVDRKLRTMRDVPAEAAARRLVGALARRGYSPGLAYSVVREALVVETADVEHLNDL